MTQVKNNKGKIKMRKGVSWRNRVHQALLVAVTLLVTHSAFAEPLLYDIRYNPLLEGETELQLVFDEEITQQPNIQCGKVLIQFITFGQMSLFPSSARKNDAGFFQLATPETILLQMMSYPEHCGYWNNVLAVFDELKEQISLDNIQALFSHVPTAWLQRLGYFSVFIEYHDLADLIDQYLQARRIYPIALATWIPTGGPTDPRWKVILNTELEMDI